MPETSAAVFLLTVATFLFVDRLCSAQMTSMCSSTAPASSECSNMSVINGSWVSAVFTTALDTTSADLSWNPDPDINPLRQRSYEIYWRRVMSMPTMWHRTQQLNTTVFDPETDLISYTFADLNPNTRYELRLCRERTPSFSPGSPPSPDCGFCTLCFRTMPASIDLLTSLITISLDGTHTLTCEASGNPTPQISWSGTWLDTGIVVPLLSNQTDDTYTITNDIVSMDTSTPPFVSSVLEFNPDLAPFESPVCLIDNGFITERVTTLEFTDLDGDRDKTPINSTSDPLDSTTGVGVEVPVPVWVIVLLVIAPLFFISFFSFIGIGSRLLYRKRKRRRVALQEQEHIKSNGLNDYNVVPLKTTLSQQDSASALYGSLHTELPSHMIIPSNQIRVSTVIGQGEFGVVYKGTLTRRNMCELVAVKTLKGIFATPNEIKSFSEEILILQNFNHPHVMSLIGVCLGANKSRGGPSIVLPFMSKGSLLDFLRKEANSLRPSINDAVQVGAVQKSLVQICLQVGRGMEYLARNRFVHRDLAARNCMIDGQNQIRVGDFGLSEDVYAKNYFRQNSNEGVKLPVKWMSPESLKLGVFSEKSDVWAYGVTCWEVFTCGEIPYPGIHPTQVPQMLEDGKRLNKPRNPACSDELYSILSSCWETDPDNRKTFTELCSAMEDQLHTMSDYLDLNLLADSTHSTVEDNPYMVADDSSDPRKERGLTYPGEVTQVTQPDGGYDEVYERDSESEHTVVNMEDNNNIVDELGDMEDSDVDCAYVTV